MDKHKEALRNVKGLVDASLPHSIDPPAQRIQAHTRRFCDDQRKAEIGRENRKLVERMNSIARGMEGGYDPRSPPPTIGKSASQPSSLSIQPPRHPKSLNETGRRKTQRTIDENNSSLVRRILHTKGTFDRAADERDFQKQKRASHVLQRMPGEKLNPKSCPKLPHTVSLPALKPPRVLGNPRMQLQGLDMLFLPGDLQRSRSGPSSLRGARSQPLALTSGSGGGDGTGRSRQPRSRSPRSRSRSPSRSRSGSRRSSRSRSRSRSRSDSREREGRDGDRDQLGETRESARREWLGGTQESMGYTQDFDFASTKRSENRETTGSLGSPQRTRSQMGMTGGYSTVSSMKYDTDDWDEENEGTTSDSRSRPPTS